MCEARRAWTAPVWLRKVREAAAYRREPVARASYTERFQLAADLMAFATARLSEQTDRRGCSVSVLRIAHEAGGQPSPGACLITRRPR